MLKRLHELVEHGENFGFERRFYTGIQNLFDLYRPLLDSLTILDNSGRKARRIAKEQSGRWLIADQTVFDQLIQKKGH